MIAKKEALEIISSTGDNCELADVKFFLGHDRNVTQEELLNEAAKGVQLLNEGKLPAIESLNGDDFKQVEFTKFA